MGNHRAFYLAALFLLLHLLAAYRFPSRLCGAAALRYVSPGLTVALILLLLLVAVAVLRPPPGLSRALRALAKARRGVPSHLVLPALAVMFAVLFLALPSNNHFLGDGFLRLEGVRAGDRSLSHLEFLDFELHALTWKGLRALGFDDVVLTYRLLHAAGGALWVLMTLALARRMTADPTLRWVIPGFLWTMGSVQFFFGYVESYTFRELALLLYFIIALRALAGRSPYPAAAALTLAAGFHMSSLALAPTLIPLFMRNPSRMEGAPSRRRAPLGLGLLWMTLLLLVPVIILFRYQDRFGGFKALLPVVPNGVQAYALFSPLHLLDLSNTLLLVCPGALLLAAWWTVGAAKRMRFSVRWAAEPEPLFWALAVLGPLGLFFLVDGKNGSCDWDLLALVGTPLTLAALWLFLRTPRASAAADARRSAAALFATACLVHTVPWIWTNHSLDRSVPMIRDMIAEDAHHYRGDNPVAVRMAFLFTTRGMRDQAIEILRALTTRRPENISAHFNLGTYLMEEGHLAESRAELERAAALGPDVFEVRLQLGLLYSLIGELPAAVREFEVAVRLRPDHGEAHWRLGVSYMSVARKEEGVAALERGISLLEPGARMLQQMAVAYAETGNWARAIETIDRAARIDPGNRETMRLHEAFRRDAGAAGAELP